MTQGTQTRALWWDGGEEGSRGKGDISIPMAEPC